MAENTENTEPKTTAVKAHTHTKHAGERVAAAIMFFLSGLSLDNQKNTHVFCFPSFSLSSLSFFNHLICNECADFYLRLCHECLFLEKIQKRFLDILQIILKITVYTLNFITVPSQRNKLIHNSKSPHFRPAKTYTTFFHNSLYNITVLKSNFCIG